MSGIVSRVHSRPGAWLARRVTVTVRSGCASAEQSRGAVTRDVRNRARGKRRAVVERFLACRGVWQRDGSTRPNRSGLRQLYSALSRPEGPPRCGFERASIASGTNILVSSGRCSETSSDGSIRGALEAVASSYSPGLVRAAAGSSVQSQLCNTQPCWVQPIKVAANPRINRFTTLALANRRAGCCTMPRPKNKKNRRPELMHNSQSRGRAASHQALRPVTRRKII